MVEAAKEACLKLKIQPGETLESFAERLYNTQVQAYDEQSGGMLGGRMDPYYMLDDQLKQNWLDLAGKLKAE